MSVKLGELLVEGGLLTQAQLESALKNQVIYGGRLGTNLIELGYLVEEDLARFLSKKLELPYATNEQLMSVSPDIIKLIPKEVAEKYKVVPLGRDKKRLTLAMIDPADLSVIDAISFITGYFISPLIAPELRLVVALEKYYGIKRDVRYIQLTEKRETIPVPETAVEAETPPDPFFGESDMGGHEGFDFSLPHQEEVILDVEEVMSAPGAATVAEPVAPPPEFIEPVAADPFSTGPEVMESVWPGPVMDEPPAEILPPEPVMDEPVAEILPPEPPKVEPPAEISPPEPVLAGLDKAAALESEPAAEGFIDIELVREEPLEEAFVAEPAPVEPAKTTTPPPTAESVAELLINAADRDEIADTIISYLGGEFDRVALFMIKGSVAEGWKGARDKAPLPAFDGLQLSLDEQSVIKIVNDGKSFYLGPVPDTPDNARLLAGLGGDAPSTALLVPLLIVGRVVAILYVDGGKTPISDRLAELQKLVSKIGMAFEILILKNKILMT